MESMVRSIYGKYRVTMYGVTMIWKCPVGSLVGLSCRGIPRTFVYTLPALT